MVQEKGNLEQNITELKANKATMNSDGVENYKEFLRRTQDQYKSLENERNKDIEKHILEINNISSRDYKQRRSMDR